MLQQVTEVQGGMFSAGSKLPVSSFISHINWCGMKTSDPSVESVGLEEKISVPL